MGIDIPKIEVRFEHLSIEGDAYVGARALPTLLNSYLNSIEVFLSPIVWYFFSQTGITQQSFIFSKIQFCFFSRLYIIFILEDYGML